MPTTAQLFSDNCDILSAPSARSQGYFSRVAAHHRYVPSQMVQTASSRERRQLLLSGSMGFTGLISPPAAALYWSARKQK